MLTPTIPVYIYAYFELKQFIEPLATLTWAHIYYVSNKVILRNVTAHSSYHLEDTSKQS